MNPFDLVAAALLVAAILAGMRTGALPQVGGISGALIGLLAMLNAAPWILDRVRGLEPLPRALVVLGVLLGSVILGEAIGSAIGRAVASRLGQGVLSGVDRLAGAFVGAAQAILIVWLAGGLLAAGPFPTLAHEASTSFSVRTTDAYLPPATEVIGQIANALDSSGLPDVFVGLEPIPLAPVDTPSSQTALKIADVAILGTPRITTRSCDVQVSGTGVVFARTYVVTNAHVVAGASTIRVSLGDQVLDATAVLFDPVLDVAVLHVPGLAGNVLRFAIEDPQRGAKGASLGFTGGGPLEILPSAVSGSYPATGRDIYGTNRVTRQILELRAAIEPGDSGGPLILEDGTVGGLVFAESKTDQSVGYALSPVSVATRIAPAVGKTGAVPLGACIR
ncbi:MAG: MarP family serine protease [Chloroflexota bacterium]